MITKNYSPNSFLKMPFDDMQKGMQRLTGGEFKLLVHLFSRNGNEPFNSIEIGKMLKLSTKTISAAHKELQIKGFLYVEHNKNFDHYVLGLKEVKEYKSKFGLNHE